VFDQFSERSRLVVFLTRMDAGRRGAAALEPAHLLQAIVREDQGELAARFAGAVTSSGSLRPPERAFLSPEAASEILSRIEQLLPPEAEPLADSADMQCSSALGETFARATALAKELHHEKVEPLHLVAAMLSIEGSGLVAILERAGISREAVIAAIQS
jgi:ATP-dependent Clp protease ATP-binding subunit ClpA